MTHPDTAPRSFTADERAEELLAMTRRLIALAKAEIESLKNRKLDGASADWAEKERLAHAWRIEVSHIKANPSALEGVSPARKAELRAAAEELETALEAHSHSLSAMKEVTEGLVRSIASEIASLRSAPAAYGRGGAVTPGGAREASGLAVDAKA
jgi:hypothetical protein